VNKLYVKVLMVNYLAYKYIDDPNLYA